VLIYAGQIIEKGDNMQTVDINIDELRPYEKNAKIHSSKQIEQIAASLLEFGWRQPLVVTADKVVVVGHGRLAGAKIARKTDPAFSHAPCLIADDLTDEQIKAYRLADNKLNESPWDPQLTEEELAGFTEIDMSAFGFDLSELAAREEQERLEEEFRQRMAAGELSEEDEEYQAFLEKFRPKKTTDDCYTPDNIYETVKEWAVQRYGLQGRRIVRPFYPGGDYQHEKYKPGDVVIDNPPFSILSEIYSFYAEHGIDYFLFAPRLTIFSSSVINVVIIESPILYENGATVPTSFVTNMGEYKIITAPELQQAVKKQNEINRKKDKVELPKYSYPPEVVTSQMLAQLCKYGQRIELRPEQVYHIRELDSQKAAGKAIFGAGFLLSESAAAEKAAAEKAAAEKAAAMRWKLSDREREIIATLE